MQAKSNDMAEYINLAELEDHYPGAEILDSLTVATSDTVDETAAKAMIEDWVAQVKEQEGADIDTPDGIPATLEPYRKLIVRAYEIVATVVRYVVLKISLLPYSRSTNQDA